MMIEEPEKLNSTSDSITFSAINRLNTKTIYLVSGKALKMKYMF